MSSVTQSGEADLSQLSRAELEQRVAELEANNSEIQQQRDEAIAERDQLRETATELRSELEAKNEQIQKLIAALRRYENAHNPSGDQWPPTGSADTDGDDDGSDDTNQDQSDESSSAAGDTDGESSQSSDDDADGTPGRNEGHEPAWRDFGEPDEVIDVFASHCSCCGSSLTEDDIYCTEPHYVEELPEPQPIITKLFLRSHYECDECGETTSASHEDCPDEGQFGHNVLAQVALLKGDHRLPNRRVAKLLDQLHDLSISHGTVFHATERVARAGRSEYEQIRESIRESDVIYIDETGISLDGEQGWIWAFTTPEETLYVVSESRGSEVIEEVLGEDLSETQVIVSDGWSAYRGYDHDVRQRCWSHILREAAFLAARYDEAVPIFRDLWQLYQSLKSFLETDPTPEQRAEVVDVATATLEEILSRECESEEVQKFQTKLERGVGHWFTFVTHPQVEPTNNRAEAAIRKAVIHRKIIRALRSEAGVFTFETLLSLLVTWDQQDRDSLNELQRTVRTSSFAQDSVPDTNLTSWASNSA